MTGDMVGASVSTEDVNPWPVDDELHDAYNRAAAPAVAGRCAGYTRARKPCRATAQEGRDYCVSHGEEDAEPEPADAKPDAKSASTLLVEIAQERYAFGVSDDGETYGVPRIGPQVVLMLRGGKMSLRGQLARTYFSRTGNAAPQQALADALLVIEGMAQEEDAQRLYLRVARQDNALWLDLGDQTGRAVKITPAGWALEETVPVLFKRTALTAALPEPITGADLDELWPWLNVAEDDRPLIVAALAAALFPDIPHPVIGLTGEQGTAKTTATKVLAGLLDPSPVLARKAPRDADSWITAASGSWVVGLENLSDIPQWLSDSICRAVTGDGDVRRKLYTDGDLAVFAFRRVIIVNGIDFGALRGDLADRMLSIELALISEEKRMAEEEFWPQWQEAHPRILGALLDLAASVMRVLPSVTLARKPRMADYARVLAAVDAVQGTEGTARYAGAQRSLATDSLTGDPFIVAIDTAIRDTIAGTFTGTSAGLLIRATPDDPKWRAPKGWPATARAVTTNLRRQAPAMRKAGWTADDDGGANHQNAVTWTLTPPPSLPREAGKSDSPNSQTRATPSDQEEQRESGENQSRAAASLRVTAGSALPAGPGLISPTGNAATSKNSSDREPASYASHESPPLSSDCPDCGGEMSDLIDQASGHHAECNPNGATAA